MVDLTETIFIILEMVFMQIVAIVTCSKNEKLLCYGCGVMVDAVDTA